MVPVVVVMLVTFDDEDEDLLESDFEEEEEDEVVELTDVVELEELELDVVVLSSVGGAPPRGPPVAGSRYQLFGGSPRHSPTVTRS
jgi:hypothetical protein